MSRALLIIDMPNSCDACPLFAGFYSDMNCRGANRRGIDYPYPADFRQGWCPLREVPEKYDMDRNKCSDRFYEFDFEAGYNQCIDEILGEEA